MRFLFASVIIGLAVPSLPGGASGDGTGQQPQVFEEEVTRTVRFSYLLYLPEDYAKTDKKWPVIVFLHGMGERGDNLELVKKHGPPKNLENKTDFPFVVISPQCPDDRWWRTDDLAAFVDRVLGGLSIDEDRVYLTGLSMGGFGTWQLACEHPEKFAAIAPICGGGEPALARWLKDIPVWAFHGAKDSVVPVERTTQMVEATKKFGGNPKLTIYPEANHDSWTETYENPELYTWFLSHSRK
jgi:predicted peptidase